MYIFSINIVHNDMPMSIAKKKKKKKKKTTTIICHCEKITAKNRYVAPRAMISGSLDLPSGAVRVKLLYYAINAM